MARSWTFNVNCKTFPGEIVCITGSCPELGNWKVDKVHPLEIQDSNDSSCYGFGGEKECTWTTNLDLPQGIDITFRYVVCCFIDTVNEDGNPDRKISVRRWETSLRPRKIACHEPCDSQTVAEFGNDSKDIQRGWLTSETVVQLKFLGEKALNIWKKRHKGKEFYIKVTPVKADRQNLEDTLSEDSQSMDLNGTRETFQRWPIIEVANLTTEDCELRPQSQFGIAYKENGFILFQAQVLELPTVAFLVDVFARRTGQGMQNYEQPAELIGSCYIMPKHFKSTTGTIKDTIVSSSKFEAIGEIELDYLVVHPIWKEGVSCDFAVTFAKHWKPHWKGIDVGHRGLGNSFTKADTCSHLRENTISSLKNAYSHGADMVEFDVHLSKDKIPVIYHDFELCTTSLSKDGQQGELIPMQLKNLTLKQLRGLKIHHVNAIDNGVKEFNEESVEDHAFPTLDEALNTIDQNCGFNIELKWDMILKDGSNECHFPFEINLFLNAVLESVLKHGQRRKIVFSSFNPDICTLIRLKQNRYPVLLLTQGINSKYDDYSDPRTWTIENGSSYVAMAEILGVNAMAEDIQRDPSQVQMIKERGQVIFVWTDDKSDSGTVKYLKELGCDGIIYDRMDVHKNKDELGPVIFCTKEAEELEKMARSPKSGCSCSGTPPLSPSSSENSEKEKEEMETDTKSNFQKTNFAGSILAN